jgi:hypothetical protein
MYGEQTAVRAELERLERTGEFDAGEIKLLRASEPLVEDLAGRPILRATRISALRGRIYISTVVLLGLTWMATIVYVDHVGLTLIIQSLGIGMAVGNVLTVVRNETSKFMRLAEKVGLVAPHLVTAY